MTRNLESAVARTLEDAGARVSEEGAGAGYTELEWNLKLQSPAATSDVYEFRVYAGSTALDTYTVTPQLTVSGGGAAIAFGNTLGHNEDDAEASTIQVTTTNTVSSGGFIVFAVSGYNDAITVTASGGGLTWATDSRHTKISDAFYFTSFVSAQAPSGLASSTVITFTYSGNAYARSAFGAYWTGIATSSAKDANSGNNGGTSYAWASAAVTTTNADDLIIGACTIYGEQSTSAPATNYTETYDSNSATTNVTYEMVHRIVSSTGSYTPGGTFSGPDIGHEWTAGGIAYKAAAGGGGTSGTATPGVIATTITAPSATGQVSKTTTPAALATTVTTPAATPQASKTITPAALVTTFAAPLATPLAGSTALPAATALAVTLPAATASGSATGTATPVAVAATIVMPAATASGATGGTATPIAIVTTTTMAQATATASGAAVPGAVVATVTLPAATASGASTGTATPSAITTTVTMPQASLTASSGTTPQAVTLTVTMPQATPQASRTATPAVVPLVVAAPAATRSGGGTASPNAVALVTVTPAPFLVYGYRVNPDAIRLTISIAAALAQGIAPDQHPVTVTMADRGHTITVAVTGTTATAREHTSTTARQGRP